MTPNAPPSPAGSSATTRGMEIAAMSHEGIAVVGRDGRIQYANARYAAFAGRLVTSMAGCRIGEIFPDVRWTELLAPALGAGDTTRFEHPCSWSTASPVWIRVSVVPQRRDGEIVGAILLAVDVTDWRAADAQRRLAQHRLTLVDEEARRRMAREIHDGPVQLLTALSFRIAAARAQAGAPSARLVELDALVTKAMADLRAILGRLAMAEVGRSTVEQLSQWLEALLDGADISLSIHDDARTPPSRSTCEAMFVVLHEIVDVCRAAGGLRSLVARVRDLRGGYELAVSGPRPPCLVESATARRRGTRRYVHGLGGWFHVTLGAESDAATAWIPAMDEPPDIADTARADLLQRAAGPVRFEPVAIAARSTPLTEADWQAVAEASHEGVIELDAELNVTFVSNRMAATLDWVPADLLGRPFRDVVRPADRQVSEQVVEHVITGAAVRFDWRRRPDADGEPRWAQVAAWPRLDAAGRLTGVVIATLDSTELHMAEHMRRTALADLASARSRAEQHVLRQLQGGPLVLLREIGGRLDRAGERELDVEATRRIRTELARAVDALQGSVDRRVHDFSIGARSATFRAALAPVLAGRHVELVFRDRSSHTPPPAEAAVGFAVAREAVTNAVVHGNATAVTITLRNRDGGYEVEISDNGSGIDPDRLGALPDHLGVRSMIERASEHGGWCRVDPGAAGGTTVTLWLPAA